MIKLVDHFAQVVDVVQRGLVARVLIPVLEDYKHASALIENAMQFLVEDHLRQFPLDFGLKDKNQRHDACRLHRNHFN